MKEHIVIICIGYLLDRILGDPHQLWHPVQGIGKLTEWIEGLLWKVFVLSEEKERDRWKKRIAGGLLVALVIGIVTGTTIGLLYLLDKFCPWLKFALECIICYQMLAMKSLKVESMKVYDALMGKAGKQKENREQEILVEEERLNNARQAVSMIVGRDTKHLTKEGIIKATVETVAENTSDGVVAPLFYMCIFGPIGGLVYKTVNTMDSMIGYKNDRYKYFGTVAARLDDIFNFIPSRLSALLMIMACSVTGQDRKNAWRIFKRDRHNHTSPNAAQTEAVCAGALNIELAGPAYYFGRLHEKPTIGDAKRQIEEEDIVRANTLMSTTANMMFVMYIMIAMAIYLKLFA